MLRQRAFGVVAVSLAFWISACGQPSTTVPAAEPSQEVDDPVCSQEGVALASAYGRVDKVVAAYHSRASEMASYQENRHGPTGPRATSQLRQRPAGEEVTLCYFDGEFELTHGPPAATTAPVAPTAGRQRDRLSIVVFSDGTAVLDAVGSRETLRTTGPPQR